MISFNRAELEIVEGDTVLYTRKQVKVGYGEKDIYEILKNEAKVLKIFDCGLVCISFAGKTRKVPASNLSKKIHANKRYQSGDRVIMEGKTKENGRRNLMVGKIKSIYDGRKYQIAFESQTFGQAEELYYFSNEMYSLTLIAKKTS